MRLSGDRQSGVHDNDGSIEFRESVLLSTTAKLRGDAERDLGGGEGEGEGGENTGEV